MKLLVIHNTLAAYRVPFFIELGKVVDLTVMFFDLEQNNKIYNDIDRTQYLRDNNVSVFSKLDKELLKNAYQGEYDFILLPALDDFQSLKIVYSFLIHHKVPNGIWWGRWVAPNIKPFSKRWIKNKLQKISSYLALKKTDLVFAYGSKSEEYAVSCGATKPNIVRFINSTTVSESIQKINLRSEHHIATETKIILYFGRIIRRKGVEILLEAFRQLPKNKFHLLICGTGEDFQYLNKKYRDKDITFTGFVKPEMRSEYYQQSDIFVIPSFFYDGTPEPWGLTVNEALQFNLPVVATTAVGAAYDLISNNVNGIVVKENDSNALSLGILKANSLSKTNFHIKKNDISTMVNRITTSISEKIKKESEFE